MKSKLTSLAALVVFSSTTLCAQIFSPIASTGYTLDAVAENTTALATTAGAIDGSNFVMYSAAYGALFSNSFGLPNSGLISSPSRTYQLQSYTVGNVMHALPSQTGTITLNTPGSFAGISILGFATEGTCSFDVTFTYTDNSTQVFANQSLPDWFGTGNVITSGFDRCSRTTGTPALSSGNPKLFALDYGFNCLNRSKSLASISFVNTNTGTSRLCIMAISGTGAPTYSSTSTAVTCVGGTNGSASVLNTGGIPPFTYTWSTTPPQSASIAGNLPVGVYSYSVQDNGGCVVTNTVAVTQSLVPEPSLVLGSSAYTVCSGATFTLGVSGAATYTWANGPTTSIYAPSSVTTTSQTSSIYTVSGTTSFNCLRTGSIAIVVNPLPAAAFASSITPQCNTNIPLLLSPFGAPTGGNFTGAGVTSGSFIPANAGVGTWTITYTRTDANNCTNSSTMAVSVASLATPAMSFAGPYCSNGATAQMTVTIPGGTFGGSGVSPSGVFTPSLAGAGSIPVGYTITNNACSKSANITILVNAAPTASIVNPKTFFCKNQNNTFFNGSPAGGAFSGNGIVNGAFSPSQALVSNSNIVVYTYTDINGCTDTASVRITVSNCTGLTEQSASTGLQFYPNPTTSQVIFEAEKVMRIRVINALGQEVKQLQLEQGTNRIQLNLAAGIYYLTGEDLNGKQTLVITE